MIPAMVVPIINGYQYLDKMMETINYPIQNLIIIDNGASKNDWTPTWNQWVSKVWHLKFPSNLGVPGSWNLGIKSLPMCNYWLISNADVEWAEDSLKMFAEQSDPNKIVLSNAGAAWCAFTIGWKVVEKVGLFDENFYPIYFEDNDYQHRAELQNIEIVNSFIPVAHVNSVSIKNGYAERNNVTFPDNQDYWQHKKSNNITTETPWNIRRIRRNSWD
jgi:GT2 family glycosyltransferase